MKTSPRIFSLEEANVLLPEIDKRLSVILEKKEKYARAHDALFIEELLCWAEHQRGASADNQAALDSGRVLLETMITALEEEIHELYEMGCLLRSVEKGWIDFLGRREGKLIYFCWKRGEHAIQYYHPFRGDRTARLPIASDAHNS